MILATPSFFANRVKIYVTIRNQTSYTRKKSHGLSVRVFVIIVLLLGILPNSNNFLFLKNKDNQKG